MRLTLCHPLKCVLVSHEGGLREAGSLDLSHGEKTNWTRTYFSKGENMICSGEFYAVHVWEGKRGGLSQSKMGMMHASEQGLGSGGMSGTQLWVEPHVMSWRE